ncbi:UBX domain-containing protein [Drechslerella dactyloides]|uniref:UBX domain-containing protein n=1 Tax=Drechslerella dactyloides TaxID=74499 RepID=A0AAD6J5F7_DREDA|nr:UBX domain-containing protein [Drechslerella dactyloides]
MDSVREELLAQFTSITGAEVPRAEQYLRLTDWNLEQAIELFFNGVDLGPPTDTGTASSSSIPTGASSSSATAPPAPPPLPATTTATSAQQPSRSQHHGRSSSDAISLDDNDDVDDGLAFTSTRATGSGSGSGSGHVDIYEDDEAMARRLQEELYAEAGNNAAGWGGGGGGGVGGGGGGNGMDFDDIRAPMARTTETLVGPDEDQIRRMVEMRNRATRNAGQSRGPVGIFNQRAPDDPLAFGDSPDADAAHRRRLAQATNGASETSSRASRLAELYTPPFDIMTRSDFSSARDIGKERLKWLMVNIQDSKVFDSQVLNRDVWKDPAIKSTIRENFIFLQYAHDSADGAQYINLYLNVRYPPPDFPHIGIIDPRTGELLKSWSRVPDKNEFLMQLHEFLERYSLDPMVKMPVQQKPKERQRGVEHMTEDEMMQLALQQSLGDAAGGAGSGSGSSGTGDAMDPDLLTKAEGKRKAADVEEEDLIDLDEPMHNAPSQAAGGNGAGAAPAEPVSVFASIAKNNHHSEPPAGAPGVTRVQFRMPDGARVVRRFLLGDKVERIFEYVKADLLPEHGRKGGDEGLADKEFGLQSLGKNLIEVLDVSIEEAGLKMATIMVDIES